MSLKDIGIDLGLLSAGGIGGAISVYKTAMKNKKLKKPPQSIWVSLTTIIVGGAVATYGTPLFIVLFHIETSAQFGIAFVLGYGGLVVMEKLLDKIGI